MIIGINGYIGSGKDTIAKMIQYADITSRYQNKTESNWTLQDLINGDLNLHFSLWEVRKFAYKLKQMVSLLTGIPVEDLEKQEVKDMLLGPEWDYVLLNTEIKIRSDFPSYPPRNYSVRELLQRLGTEAVRDQVHPNAWVNALFADYKNMKEQFADYPTIPSGQINLETGEHHRFDLDAYPNWIISDTRFENEAQAIKDRGGLVWRVNRTTGNHNTDTIHSLSRLHSSETALDSWSFDYVIENSGTLEDLYQQVLTALKHFKLI